MTQGYVSLSISRVLSLCEDQRRWAEIESEKRNVSSQTLYLVGDLEALCRVALEDGQSTIQVTPHDYGRLSFHLPFQSN
jgi:hypothetical protein